MICPRMSEKNCLEKYTAAAEKIIPVSERYHFTGLRTAPYFCTKLLPETDFCTITKHVRYTLAL